MSESKINTQAGAGSVSECGLTVAGLRAMKKQLMGSVVSPGTQEDVQAYDSLIRRIKVTAHIRMSPEYVYGLSAHFWQALDSCLDDIKDGETVCQHGNRPFECGDCGHNRIGG